MLHIAASQTHRKGGEIRIACLLVLGVALAVLLSSCSGSVPNQILFTDSTNWQAQLVAGPYPGESAAFEPAALEDTLAQQGVEASWDGPVLSLQGQGGVEQVRRLVFGDLSSLLAPLQGGTVLTLQGAVNAGQAFNFTLESNPSSGYSWQVDPAGTRNLRQTGDPTFEAATARVGAPLRQTIPMAAETGGAAVLQLVYRRPWLEDPAGPGGEPAQLRSLDLQAPTLDMLADLSDPSPLRRVTALDGLTSQDVPAPLGLEQGDLPPVLPAAYDWRTLGKVPPIRNQGSCGSCWAFATVGALESAIMIGDGVGSIDLSEQYLVSCNQDGWGCNGGGTAHDYHWWKKMGSESLAGAVPEAELPYQNSDVPCSGSYTHPYQIQGWGYAGNPGTPDTQAIKQAIYKYGPVKVSMCIGNAFQAYSGGVFNKDESSVCGGGTNHAVVLVGWDDSQGPNGVWILRNSWGVGWGEAGYMRIDRSVSGVGRYASYVIYQGTPKPYSVFIPLVTR